MKMLPLVPTLLVAVAIGIMIWLGMWQLDRLHAKQAALATYSSSADSAPLAFPPTYSTDTAKQFAFRRGTGYCALVTEWSASAGTNTQGESGWSHFANCFTGEAQAQTMLVDIGWSHSKENPQWQGGQVNGTIAPDNAHILKIVSDEPAYGLEASARPALSDLDNPYQGAYWWVWFTFAALAPVIYILALRRRAR